MKKVVAIASYSLIFIGIICIVWASYLFWQRVSPVHLSFTFDPSFEKVSAHEKTVMPTRLVIDTVHIDLSIYSARIQKEKWEVTEKGASYLSSSAIPGEKGNAIMYGHNWAHLMGSLTSVNIGDTVDVYMSDNTKKVFRIVSTATVNPDQADVLKSTQDTRLTLYTCTGFLDSKRFVAVAKIIQ